MELAVHHTGDLPIYSPLALRLCPGVAFKAFKQTLAEPALVTLLKGASQQRADCAERVEIFFGR